MGTEAEVKKVATGKELFVKMAVSAWQTQITRLNDLLEKLSDEQLKKEVAPGRNTGTYILGHLTAVHDNLIKLLGFGEKLYPELETAFIKNPDKSGIEIPSVDELKKYWKNVDAKINEHINSMQPDDWFTRHSTVSEEDFVKEPHRNKLNVLMNRTSHISYHLGQLVFLIKK